MKPEREINSNRTSEAKLEQLIGKYQESLIKHAFYMLGSVQDAEDVTQDIFVKFYFQPPVLSDSSKIKAYLYRMVHNACIDLLRNRKQEQQVHINSLINLPDEQLNGGRKEVMLQKEFLRINEWMQQIPEEQAFVIRMRIVSKLSFKEIARTLELPVTTVKSRFTYGLNKLRKLTGIKKEVYDEL